eukprot:COSAG04_NODE_1742_length_5722_cov_23.916593_4_plen_205_part_00
MSSPSLPCCTPQPSTPAARTDTTATQPSQPVPQRSAVSVRDMIMIALMFLSSDHQSDDRIRRAVIGSAQPSAATDGSSLLTRHRTCVSLKRGTHSGQSSMCPTQSKQPHTGPRYERIWYCALRFENLATTPTPLRDDFSQPNSNDRCGAPPTVGRRELRGIPNLARGEVLMGRERWQPRDLARVEGERCVGVASTRRLRKRPCR